MVGISVHPPARATGEPHSRQPPAPAPKIPAGPFDPKEYDYWMPVDCYTGGVEHATMHLIYTRFFTKALRDMGLARDDEPMTQLRNQGIILGEDSEKMSKSRGNVVAPDELVNRYGADAVRAYLMFFARWEQGAPWNSSGIEGTVRWLNRVWIIALPTNDEGRTPSTSLGGQATQHAIPLRFASGTITRNAQQADVKALRRLTHQTIKQV